MNNFFINTVFCLFTLFIFIELTTYGIYEIKNENNIFGGISTIVMTLISIVFVNVMVWIS